MQYKVVLNFQSVDEILNSQSVIIQMKATEQYFPVVLSIMQYNFSNIFDSVDKICKRSHSNESWSFSILWISERYTGIQIDVTSVDNEISRVRHFAIRA